MSHHVRHAYNSEISDQRGQLIYFIPPGREGTCWLARIASAVPFAEQRVRFIEKEYAGRPGDWLVGL